VLWYASCSGADAVKAHLDRIHHAGLKGVRRLTQAEADVNLCLQKDFVEVSHEISLSVLLIVYLYWR